MQHIHTHTHTKGFAIVVCIVESSSSLCFLFSTRKACRYLAKQALCCALWLEQIYPNKDDCKFWAWYTIQMWYAKWLSYGVYSPFGGIFFLSFFLSFFCVYIYILPTMPILTAKIKHPEYPEMRMLCYRYSLCSPRVYDMFKSEVNLRNYY